MKMSRPRPPTKRRSMSQRPAPQPTLGLLRKVSPTRRMPSRKSIKSSSLLTKKRRRMKVMTALLLRR